MLRTPYGRLWQLGARLHPETVADQWYAAECPNPHEFKPVLDRVTWIRWRVACRLRGCK